MVKLLFKNNSKHNNAQLFIDACNDAINRCNKQWEIEQDITIDFTSNMTEYNGIAKKRSNGYDYWGNKAYKYYIYINYALCEKKDITNVCVHEILHTYKNCMRHTNEWLEKATIMNSIYKDLHIQRCNNYKRIEEYENVFKYFYQCPICNHIFKYRRQPKYINRSYCNCKDNTQHKYLVKIMG